MVSVEKSTRLLPIHRNHTTSLPSNAVSAVASLGGTSSTTRFWRPFTGESAAMCCPSGEISIEQAAPFAPIRVVRAGEGVSAADEEGDTSWNAHSA